MQWPRLIIEEPTKTKTKRKKKNPIQETKCRNRGNKWSTCNSNKGIIVLGLNLIGICGEQLVLHLLAQWASHVDNPHGHIQLFRVFIVRHFCASFGFKRRLKTKNVIVEFLGLHYIEIERVNLYMKRAQVHLKFLISAICSCANAWELCGNIWFRLFCLGKTLFCFHLEDTNIIFFLKFIYF